ncbi:hypothetical protein [Photorhabdus heterorhabditis]|uniref:hypothetical protein n=1 Tax=Photorhabdus heterorhabditis TaxID=880156 RepID=UPI0020B8EF6B|nr:hypothetical protein [Photorhabdus heterorhabditis]
MKKLLELHQHKTDLTQQMRSLPLVSFLTYVAGGITLLLSSLFLGEKIGLNKCFSFIMIMIGVYFFFSFSEQTSNNYRGVLLALLAGLGYALFIFLSNSFLSL